MAFIMFFILPGDLIILRISPNCLMSWFTCMIEVPEPAAMRWRREALMISGRERS